MTETITDLSFFVHPSALVETDKIGAATKIWAFVHILKGAAIGCRCNVGDHCFIEDDVRIQDDVVIKNGVSIWKGVTIESRVFIGPNAAFTNDLFPRAKSYRTEYDRTIVKKGASIGANATLVCPLTIGRYALVGAGSVVTADVPDFALVYGNPARVQGWVCRCGKKMNFDGDNKARCRCGLYLKDGELVRSL